MLKGFMGEWKGFFRCTNWGCIMPRNGDANWDDKLYKMD